MKRFLIPAFFVVHADDEDRAEYLAAKMKDAANSCLHAIEGDAHLLLDEELPNREVPINDEETELPHTYLEEQQRRDEKHGLYPEHEDIAN